MKTFLKKQKHKAESRHELRRQLLLLDELISINEQLGDNMVIAREKWFELMADFEKKTEPWRMELKLHLIMLRYLKLKVRKTPCPFNKCEYWHVKI